MLPVPPQPGRQTVTLGQALGTQVQAKALGLTEVDRTELVVQTELVAGTELVVVVAAAANDRPRETRSPRNHPDCEVRALSAESKCLKIVGGWVKDIRVPA